MGKFTSKVRKGLTWQKTKIQLLESQEKAYNKLVEIVNESSESMSAIASALIIQGSELIVYDREEE